MINGTFETDDTTGWTTFTAPGGTLGGPAFPNVTAFDTNNDSVSTNAAQFLVGDGGGGIFQIVEIAGGDLTVSADIASDAPLADSEGGLFELLFNGVVVDSHDFGAMNAGETKHDSLSASLSPVPN